MLWNRHLQTILASLFLVLSLAFTSSMNSETSYALEGSCSLSEQEQFQNNPNVTSLRLECNGLENKTYKLSSSNQDFRVFDENPATQEITSGSYTKDSTNEVPRPEYLNTVTITYTICDNDDISDCFNTPEYTIPTKEYNRCDNDADGDGFGDCDEEQFGTDPQDPASYPGASPQPEPGDYQEPRFGAQLGAILSLIMGGLIILMGYKFYIPRGRR